MTSYLKGELPTRTIKTENSYLNNYERLRRRFMRETVCDDMDPDSVVAHLLINKDSYSMTSWRTYKSSVIFVLERYYPQCHLAIDLLLQESSIGLARTSTKTSGNKLKNVPLELWNIIRQTLHQRIDKGHKHSQGLLHVLTATLLAGLRPSEWSDAVIAVHENTGRKILRVKNSKNTNGRANGFYRELFIDYLTSDEISIIESAVAYCRVSSEHEEQRIQLALKNEFSIVKNQGKVRKQDPLSSVAMYDFRHQFISDAKATFSDPIVIAALAGHNSTKTAFENYGKRNKGYSKIRVQPTPETIVAVLNTKSVIYRSTQSDLQSGNDYTPTF